MLVIKENDILCCVNEKDCHFLKFCKVENIICYEHCSDIKSVMVRYENETIMYKALDMEYNFIIVKGLPLIFD